MKERSKESSSSKGRIKTKELSQEKKNYRKKEVRTEQNCLKDRN